MTSFIYSSSSSLVKSLILNPLKRSYLNNYHHRLILKLLAARDELSSLEERFNGCADIGLRPSQIYSLQEALIEQRVRVEALEEDLVRVEEEMDTI